MDKTEDNILRNFGGLQRNDLSSIISDYEDDIYITT